MVAREYYRIKVSVERVILTHQLESGMELARDLHVPGGQLLFSAHTVLRPIEISQIKRFNIQRVTICKSHERWVDQTELNQMARDYEILETREINCIESGQLAETTSQSPFEAVFQLVQEAETPQEITSILELLRDFFDEQKAASPVMELDDLLSDSHSLEDFFYNIQVRVEELPEGQPRRQFISRLQGITKELQSLRENSEIPPDLLQKLEEYTDRKQTLQTETTDFVGGKQVTVDEMEKEALAELGNEKLIDSLDSPDQFSRAQKTEMKSIRNQLDEKTSNEAEKDRLLAVLNRLQEEVPESTPSDQLSSELSDLFEKYEQRDEQLTEELSAQLKELLVDFKEEKLSEKEAFQQNLISALKEFRQREWRAGVNSLEMGLSNLFEGEIVQKAIAPLENAVGNCLAW